MSLSSLKEFKRHYFAAKKILSGYPDKELTDFYQLIPCYRNKAEINASFDAGWQKRGSGRAYNSLSGIVLRVSCLDFFAIINDSCNECFTNTGIICDLTNKIIWVTTC